MISSSSTEKALHKALKKMLKPLVKLLISQGVTYIGFLDMLKRTYVEVADESFTLKSKRQTDSRVSLLTGVHRADVKRIRNEAKDALSEKEIKASKSAQIMALWTGHQAYLDEQAKPVPLPVSAVDDGLSFESLVKSVSKDKHPRSILDDWLHQGIVTLRDDNYVVLSRKGYIPSEDFEEKLFFAGKNIGDHLSIVAHNLMPNEQALFDRAVYYSNLSKTSADELETLSQEKMMAVLTELNKKASTLQNQDNALDNANYAIHIGAYFNKKEQQND